MAEIPNIDWGIASCLKEIYKDNTALLQNIALDDVAAVVSMIKRANTLTQVDEYFIVLASLCKHNDHAMVKNQDWICSLIENLVPRLRMADDGVVEIKHRVVATNLRAGGRPGELPDLTEDDALYPGRGSACYINWEEQWSTLEAFLQGGNGVDEIAFLVAVTKLLCNICFDRRHKSQKLVREIFAPFKIAFTVIKDSKVHPLVRTGFVSLVRVLYVDTDPLLTSPNILDRIWADLDDQERLDHIADDIAKLVPDYTKWSQDLVVWGSDLIVSTGASLANVQATEHLLPRSTSEACLHQLALEQSSVSQQTRATTLFTDKAKRRRRSSGWNIIKANLHTLAPGAANSMSRRSGSSWSTKGSSWSLSGFVKSQLDIRKQLSWKRMILETLRLLRDTIRHGFTDTTRQRNDLMGIMVTLLKNAQTPSNRVTGAAAQVLKEMKIVACDILVDLVKLWINDVFISSFLRNFQDSAGTMGKAYANVKVKCPPTEELEQLNIMQQMDFFKAVAEPSDRHLLQSQVNALTSMHGKQNAFLWPHQVCNMQSDEILSLLLDLGQTQDTALTNVSLDLLFLTFNVKGYIVKIFEDMTITAESDEVRTLQMIRKQLTTLCETRHRSSDTMTAELLPIVAWLVTTLHMTNRESDTVAMHRRIMRNESVHLTIVRLIEDYLIAHTDEQIYDNLQDVAVRTLLITSFEFLSAFVRNDRQNQLLLSAGKHFPFWLRCCRYGVGADILLGLIIEHPEVEAKLSTEAIKGLVRNLYDYASCRAASYVRMLQHVLAPDGRTSVERQTHFVNVFLKEQRYFDELGGDQAKNEGNVEYTGITYLMSLVEADFTQRRAEDRMSYTAGASKSKLEDLGTGSWVLWALQVRVAWFTPCTWPARVKQIDLACVPYSALLYHVGPTGECDWM